MDRRGFIGTAVGGVVATTTSHAKSTQIHRVGFLVGASAESVASLFKAFNEGMSDRGYVEGRNLFLDARFANGRVERLPELAAELVRLRVESIVTGTNFHVAAVRRVTTTVPIVMVFAADPVRAGFVTSLAHPGGNVTGLSSDAGAELWAKYLGLMREIVPKLSRVGALGQVSARAGFAELEAASQQSGIALTVADLNALEDLDAAFAEMVSKRVEAIVVIVGPLTYQLRKPIADLALKNRLPTISTLRNTLRTGCS